MDTPTTPSPQLSLVICVYNEAGNIHPLIKQIQESLADYAYELIFVNDGSTDSSLAELKASDHPNLKIIDFQKNYGQSAALAAGLAYAKGDYIITLDGDLQNDPSDIPVMIQLLESEDLDLVTGVRLNRQDKAFRKWMSKTANSLIRWISGVRQKDFGCTLKVFRPWLAKEINLYGELHRLIPLLAQLEGARVKDMDVKHHPRIRGKSKYGMGRTLKVLSDLLLLLFMKKYLVRPMHLFGNLGFLLFAGGLGINLYLFILKLSGEAIWGKPVMILGIILLISGIQLITFGIITDIQMRTYHEAQGKKPYRIRRIISKESSDEPILLGNE